MSNPYIPNIPDREELASSSNPYLPVDPRFSVRPQASEYQQQLNTTFDQQMAGEMQERRKIQPLRMIFDLLQRGQYVSANIAEEIIKAARGLDPLRLQDLGAAVQEGLTGETKGSYVNILKEYTDLGEKRLFKNLREESRLGQVNWAGVLGFLGDVLLDPLTYVPLGGASKAAVTSARTFADDAVRLTLRELSDNIPKLRQVVRGSTDDALAKITKALDSTDVVKAMKTLTGQGDDLGRFLDMTWREANSRALRRTEQALTSETAQRLGRFEEPTGGLRELADSLEAGQRYRQAGTRFKTRLFGKERGVDTAGPIKSIMQAKGRGMEQLGNMIKSVPGVEGLRKAYWGVMNRGTVGAIRSSLGIRNPYQKYLRQMEQEAAKHAQALAVDYINATVKMFDGVPDNQLDEIVEFIARREHAIYGEAASASDRLALGGSMGSVPRGRFDAGSLPDKVKAIQKAPATQDAAAKLQNEIADKAYEVKGLLDDWYSKEVKMAESMNESLMDYREWYLPEIFRSRSGGMPKPTASRAYTFTEQQAKEADLWKSVLGVDDQMAQQIVSSNASGLGVNIKEMLVQRAVQHAKIEGRYNLVQQFKEFGINLADSTDPAAAALKMGGRDIEELGLKNLDHAALEGYVFDKDVAAIFNRALGITGNQKNIFTKATGAYMTWWKSMVLLTSGYTMRNFMSNTTTQVLRHGARAFDPQDIQDSIAAVLYITRKTDPAQFPKLLKTLGKDEKWLTARLARQRGNFTVQQLADYGWDKDVISKHLFAFDPEDIVKKAAGKKTRGPIRRVARKVNSFLENVPRFQSFLIDYTDNAARLTDNLRMNADALMKAEDPILLEAAREARRWFIDYSDLTDVEKGLTKIIPFYTWMRKNIANQINGVALYPELYALIPKVEDLFTYEDPNYDPAMIPEWMRQEGMFPIGETETGYKMFRPDLAHMDLNMIPLMWEEGSAIPTFDFEELKHDIVGAASPILKWLAGQMTENGYDFFYRNELNETGDAPYLMRLLASRPGTILFIDGLFKRMGMEDGAKLYVDERDGKLQMDAQMAQTLESFLPVLRQAEFLFYLPQTFFPGLEDMIERGTNAKSDYEDAEQVMQMLSYYLGIKTKEVDIEREKLQLGRDVYYSSTRALNEQRRDNPGAENRRLRSQQRTDETIRRLGG